MLASIGDGSTSWKVLTTVSLLVLVLILLRRRNRKLKEEIFTVLVRYGEMYGLEIIAAVERDFGYEPGCGSVYPALRQLERQGLVTTRWGDKWFEERGGARHRYYQRTGTQISQKP